MSDPSQPADCTIVAAPGSMVAELIGDAQLLAEWEGRDAG